MTNECVLVVLILRHDDTHVPTFFAHRRKTEDGRVARGVNEAQKVTQSSDVQ